eukprot:TRINITY_DN90655_c0_g1_i1.p1 TRINITY_DN90655_c0_g1~~TRINITY_DN90655_c0_g1_i1.p1  ORF type:complete len:544 (-),score=111.06 TRINITY_DN90655_c0_g1_i1:37-1668(-)
MPVSINRIMTCAAVLLAAVCLGPCSARRFRNGPSGRSILLEVEDVLGKNMRKGIEGRAARLEDTLQYTFKSLPKNERGAVRAPVARYALHRLFVQLHGWQMKGLELDGDAWHHNSPMEAFGRRVPTRLYNLLHDRLENHGLDLLELSVMGALLENMVHSQAEARLNTTLRALQVNSSEVDREKAFEVMQIYLATYIIGKEEDEQDELEVAKQMLKTKSRMDQGYFYPRWTAAKQLLEKAAEELAPRAKTFETGTILTVLDKVANRIFHLENEECASMRDRLIALEDHEGSGRVPLGEFYRPTVQALLTGSFSESEGYLARHGALDETDPKMKRVIISNYLLMDSNCLASSGYYAVCCIDVCEDLMTQLEMKLQAPAASASKLLELVSATTVPGTPGNHSITADLVQRLEAIAEHHGGEVLLHGRLFAQWIHHVFPRACPFPHEAGTIAEVDHPLEASAHDMQKHIAYFDEVSTSTLEEQPARSRDEVLFGMWSAREELVEPAGHKERSRGSLLTTVLMLLAAVIGAVVTLAKLTPEKGSCKLD